MFAPLTDKVKQKSASSRTLTHGMKRLKKSETFHGSTRIACFSARHSLCCNGRTRQRFSSALCGGRAPAHDRLLAAPLRGSPLWVMEKQELSLSASSLLQDETTLIVARPAEKIKRRSHEIFSSFFFLRLQEFRKKLAGAEPLTGIQAVIAGEHITQAAGQSHQLKPGPAEQLSRTYLLPLFSKPCSKMWS